MATNTQKKAQAHMAARDTRPAAHAKYVRISSRKVKIVIDLIRGKNVDDALAILQYTPKAAAPVVHKLLSSAIVSSCSSQRRTLAISLIVGSRSNCWRSSSAALAACAAVSFSLRDTVIVPSSRRNLRISPMIIGTA